MIFVHQVHNLKGRCVSLMMVSTDSGYHTLAPTLRRNCLFEVEVARIVCVRKTLCWCLRILPADRYLRYLNSLFNSFTVSVALSYWG